MNRRFRAYRQVRITTADNSDLLVMLYDGLVRFTTLAARSLDAQLFAEAGKALDRVLAIIGHLRDSLRESESPELVKNLDTMYAAWMKALVGGQIKKDTAVIREIIVQMEDMRDVWKQARSNNSGAVAEGA